MQHTFDRRTFLIQLSASAIAAGAARAWGADTTAPATPAKTVRLLTIGNSFSRNATNHLGDIVKAADQKLIHHQAAVGGATMELHWKKVEQFEQDPKDKRGLYVTGLSLKQELTGEPWDFVTIQQASLRSHDPATYRPFAQKLADYIRRHSPTAQLLIHQTWAYRRDDPRFAAESASKAPPGDPTTQEVMYRGLTSAYHTIAGELGARVIPVGDAFYRADTDPTWGYRTDDKFDFKQAQPPSLPNQTHSLHVGWRWVKQKDGKQALKLDGHHANVAGEYLGGCVFFGVIFGAPPREPAFVPKGVDADYARFLRQTAARTVAEAATSSG